MTRPGLPIMDRFWMNVDVRGEGECWPWKRSTRNGYGQFRIRPGEPTRKAHRLAWVFAYQEDPGDLDVLHRCDNPPCCNPSDLFLGDQAANVRDMIAKGRAAQPHVTPSLVAGVRRLTDEQIAEARRRSADGESGRSIARDLGVAQSTVARLVSGQHWAWLRTD